MLQDKINEVDFNTYINIKQQVIENDEIINNLKILKKKDFENAFNELFKTELNLLENIKYMNEKEWSEIIYDDKDEKKTYNNIIIFVLYEKIYKQNDKKT